MTLCMCCGMWMYFGSGSLVLRNAVFMSCWVVDVSLCVVLCAIVMRSASLLITGE